MVEEKFRLMKIIILLVILLFTLRLMVFIPLLPEERVFGVVAVLIIFIVLAKVMFYD